MNHSRSFHILWPSALLLASVFCDYSSATTSTVPVPKLDYAQAIDSAENLTRSERWLEAADMYKQALRSNPASPLNSKIFANLGLCLTRTEQYGEALEAFDIALIKEPGSASIHASRAATSLLMGNREDARLHLEIALSLDSLLPSALRMHGQLMLLDGNTEAALSEFSRLTTADPADEWGPGGRAQALAIEGKDLEASGLFQQALLLRENPDFRISLISSLLSANRLSDAENAIRESIKLYPEMGEFYLLRAVMHQILHQNRDAEQDKKLAVQYGIDPQTIDELLHQFVK